MKRLIRSFRVVHSTRKICTLNQCHLSAQAIQKCFSLTVIKLAVLLQNLRSFRSPYRISNIEWR